MNKSLTGKFGTTIDNGVTCSLYYDGYLYIGTASGMVYRTVDGYAHEEFWGTGDGAVTAIGTYAGALFVGTGPDGKVLMHNFSTGNRFHYVTTGDYEINSFIEHNNVFYAATGPSGSIFSFNGEDWVKEYEALFEVSSMVSYSDKLYVFFIDSPTFLNFNNDIWEFSKNSDNIFSISSIPKVKTSIESLTYDRNSDTGVKSATIFDGKIYFVGNNTGFLYSYDGKTSSVDHIFDNSPIFGVFSNESQIFVAIDDVIYTYSINEALENV